MVLNFSASLWHWIELEFLLEKAPLGKENLGKNQVITF